MCPPNSDGMADNKKPDGTLRDSTLPENAKVFDGDAPNTRVIKSALATGTGAPDAPALPGLQKKIEDIVKRRTGYILEVRGRPGVQDTGFDLKNTF
jgi:hypothetical protein